MLTGDESQHFFKRTMTEGCQARICIQGCLGEKLIPGDWVKADKEGTGKELASIIR
jgi:hypothetical protein